jgi:signal transduction histidine kinase
MHLKKVKATRHRGVRPLLREHGTGLGLSTVYEIVRRSGGVLSVTSVLGEGTQFEVQFPLVEESAQTTIPETRF